MLTYQINIVPKWLVINNPLYMVDTNNKVRNVKTGKVLQMQLKGYTKGYYINGNFKSLQQLRKLLVKYEEVKCPF